MFKYDPIAFQFYRLDVISVEMPPLRNCPDDVPRLAAHYLKHFAGQLGRNVTGFSNPALARLSACPWPGNLRELRNAIERAVILSRQDRIEAEDLPLDPGGQAPNGHPAPQPGDLISMEKLEDFHIRRVLQRTGSVAEAARILGIDDATIYRKRKKSGWPALPGSAPGSRNLQNFPGV